jgi:hypothetical protein
VKSSWWVISEILRAGSMSFSSFSSIVDNEKSVEFVDIGGVQVTAEGGVCGGVTSRVYSDVIDL